MGGNVMTSNRDRLGGFEEKLLGELKTVVAQRSAEQSGPVRARTPLWRRPRVVSAVSAGALAIGAVSVALLGSVSTAPSAMAAFDVRANDDGTVTVTIYRFDDADGLEEQLAEYGVPADVTYTPIGERCQADRYELSSTQHQVDVDHGTQAGVPLNVNDVELWFTLRPDDFQPDETLVIENNLSADEIGSEPDAAPLRHEANVATAIGPVEPCDLEAG
jgi:hypothetical protein